MKATIEFPDFIDENEWEFVGYGQINVGEYGLLLLNDTDWSIADCKEFEAGSDTLFCFHKKQKFVWPECFKDGTEISYYEAGVLYENSAWLIKLNNSYTTVKSLNVALTKEYNIDTSMLDKNKVYIKGGD